MAGFDAAVLVAGSTIHTAGFFPTAIRAVQGKAICSDGLSLTVPTTALPSVVAGEGCWIAILTRTVELLVSIADNISLNDERRHVGIGEDPQRNVAAFDIAKKTAS